MRFKDVLAQIDGGYDLPDDPIKDQEKWQDDRERIAGIMSRRQFRDGSDGLVSPVVSVGRIFTGSGNLKKLPYKEFLRTDYWRETRRQVLQDRGYRCEVCRKTYGPGTAREVDVHHMTYGHRGEEFWAQEDLAVLCKKCHEEHHMGLIDANAIIRNRRKAAVLAAKGRSA